MSQGIFDFVASELCGRTDLAELEARGTVRLALKEAGLDPRNVTRQQMEVTLSRVMPRELSARGVEQPERVCQALVEALAGASLTEAPQDASPEEIFRRLARS